MCFILFRIGEKVDPINKKHTVFYTLIRPLAVLFVKLKFGYQYEVAKDLPENYLVLSNHTTDYDLVFVAASFPRMMYFVGSEHIARWKKLYWFLKFAFAPIMRPKGASAAHTIKEMMRTVKKGGNVCLFAEGVRSWDGAPSPIAPSTAKMVQRLGCGLVTYRIEGGYFASPMWCGTKIRKGRVHGAPVNVYTREQLAEMSTAQIYAAICDDLGEDAYARQLSAPEKYQGKALAEGLEYLLFTCPKCGRVDTIVTHDSTVSCSHCGLTFRYNEYGMLDGAPFQTLKEYSDWQKEQVLYHFEAGEAYTASGTLTTIRSHQETVVAEGAVTMTADMLRCGDMEFPMQEIYDLAMHGQRAIVFTAGKTYYELVIAEHVNALKFFLFYNACKRQATEKVR